MPAGVSLGGKQIGGNAPKIQSAVKQKISTQKKGKGGTLKDLTGSVSPEKVTKSSFNQGLKQNNRAEDNGVATDPRLAYAYSALVEADKSISNSKGAPSLFNEYAIVVHNKSDLKNKFFDTDADSNRFQKKKRVLNLDNILTDFTPSEGNDPKPNSTPYNLSDFLFAKHFGKIPLNHLITLRRFPFPTYDNLKFEGDRSFKPLAQAVTYFGEPTGNDLAEITKFTGSINWEKLTADVNDVEGDERGFSNTPFVDKLQNGGPKSRAAFNITKHAVGVNQGRSQTGQFNKDQQDRYKLATDFNHTNKVLGPVNVIMDTYVRQRGISATNPLELTFEYELRSFSNINPRIALIDLMCNMLALSYNNAKFWGGANRYFPNLEAQQFGFIGDQNKFYSGDYAGYVKSFVGQMGTMLGNGFNALGSLLGNILTGNLAAAGKALMGGATYVMDLERAKSRPKVLGFKALLTGLPTGEWHMTVGNPYDPIMSVGNLIVKGFEFHFDGALGVDDFPTKLKFTISLEHGRPRDKGDIESVFNSGEGRIYCAPKGQADVANMSAATGTVVTDGSKKGRPKEELNYLGSKAINNPPIVQVRGNQQVEFAKQVASGSVF